MATPIADTPYHLVSFQKVSPFRGTVILEGARFEELLASKATGAAIDEAERAGMQKPALSNASGVYPVDETGKIYDVPGQKVGVLRYRRDFDISSSPF